MANEESHLTVPPGGTAALPERRKLKVSASSFTVRSTSAFICVTKRVFGIILCKDALHLQLLLKPRRVETVGYVFHWIS